MYVSAMQSLDKNQLDAYMARIGVADHPALNPEGLAAVQDAHRRAIPFENLDVRLGKGVSLEPEAIFEKLVASRRGGYCFEHNGLHLRVLAAWGFRARPLLARVWLRAEGVPPRTHQLSLVNFADGDWIADVGFGAGHAPPMKLEPGQITSADGARHTLARDSDHGWMLLRDAVPQYSFTENQVWHSDLIQSNYWCMSAPTSRFVRSVVVSRLVEDELVSLQDTRLTQGGNAVDLTDAGRYREVLADLFGITLSRENIAALRLFPT
jgi:N-hydroxyarylamine O-acetyltransferase